MQRIREVRTIHSKKKLKLTKYKCFGKKKDFSRDDAYDDGAVPSPPTRERKPGILESKASFVIKDDFKITDEEFLSL